MLEIIKPLVDAFGMAFAMGWEILWPLILGFALSAAVQAVVSHSEMSRLLPNDSPRSIAISLALGAASSSCSYAAVALARSLFRKGANFTAAMAFELASTNLVLELSIIMVVLLGWQFALAEFIGAFFMVAILVLLFRTFLGPDLVREAKEQADRGIAGRMEGHADMDMSVTEGPLWQRLTSSEGLTAISHYFVMDLASVWLDIAGGLLIAGALAAWVPSEFWRGVLLCQSSAIGEDLGSSRRACGRSHFVRLLCGKHPARGGVVERRDQFRRCDRVHLRRSDRAADPRHLSKVLRVEDGGLSPGYLLCRNGGGRVRS
jgi:uncharacterized protein